MNRCCELTGREFAVSKAEQEYCVRNDIPLPRHHPIERIRNMFAFRNRMHLYNGACAYSGAKIFTCYPPDSKQVVYDVEVWESDKWDARSYGRPYDFKRSFFEQFRELYQATPIPNLAVLRSTMENSNYTNGITGAKNCYLLFGASYNEECLFSFCVNNSRNVVDCVHVDQSELCFDCTHIAKCYNLRHSENCHNCSDSSFLFSCNSCKNCFGCVNLFNRQYYFFNEALSRAEYERRISQIDLGSAQTVALFAARFAQHRLSFPIKFIAGTFNENVSGNYLMQNRRVMNSFFVDESEDVEWSIWLTKAKSSFFYCAYGNSSELIYNSVSCGDQSYNLKFCADCFPSARDLEYCIFTGYGSSNCFGCVGLKRASYCILNQEYKKEEYFDLLSRIKKQMLLNGEYGLFFPPSISPFYYNRSDAQSFFPGRRESVTKLGYRWTESPNEEVRGASPVPDNIRDVSDEVLGKTFSCARTGKRYKILRQELDFYRRQSIPLPTIAPLDRIIERSRAVEIRELQESSCKECGAKLSTMFADHPAGVYCEVCFQQAAS